MKKHYIVTVLNPSDWDSIHELLTQDGTLEDNIPSRSCECTDIQDDNDTRSTYLLDEEEVELIKTNQFVKSVNIDVNFHREENPTGAERIRAADRFPADSKIYRQTQNDGVISPPNSFTHGDAPSTYPTVSTGEQYRTGYQYSRVKQYSDPYSYNNPEFTEPRQRSSGAGQTILYPELYTAWWQERQIKQPSNVLSERVTYENDGTDIDCVIVDDGVWMGHPEFVDEDGTRLVRDIIVDGPYAIDPGWFDADPTNRLRQYMGVTTPTDAEARLWWTNSSNRSPQFANIGTLTGLGEYSLLEINGDNENYSTFDFPSASHGTAAASLVYGKSFGHAFNSNKWTILFDFGEYYPVSSINVWKALRIWHLNKPERNPLVINASIQNLYPINFDGFLSGGQKFPWYWKYRDDVGSFQAATLSGVTTQSEVENILQEVPAFLRTSAYQIQGLPNTLRGTVNSPTNLGGYTVEYDTIAELCSISDVFIFVAGGNQRQKVVKPNHPDYNNYVAIAQSPTEEQKIYTHRGGYIYDVVPSGFTERPVFHVGALDDNRIKEGTSFKERITSYSTRGNGVDIYAPADDVIAAAGEPYIYAASGPYFFPRYEGDSEYTGQSVPAYDTRFNGTSAASPVAAGFFAAFLQTRRDWSALKLKSYIKNSITDQSSLTFYYGEESVSAFDNNHYDLFTLEGGAAKVLYNAPVPSINITQDLPATQVVAEGNIVAFTVFADETAATGRLLYQWEKADSVNPTEFTPINGATSRTYAFTASATDNNDNYRCQITATGGYDGVYSSVSTLTVQAVAPGSQPFLIYQTYGLNNDGLDFFCVGVYAKRIRAGNGNNAANYTYTNTNQTSIIITLDDVEDLTTGMYAHLFPTINYSTRPDGSVNELYSKVTITNISGNDVTLTHSEGGSVLIADLNYLPDVITRITFSPTDINKEVCFRPTDTSPPFSASPIGLTTNFDVAMVDNFTSNGGGNLNPNGKVTYSALEIKHDLNDINNNVIIYSSQTISNYLPIEDNNGNTFYMMLGN